MKQIIDTPIWCGATSVLFSWMFISKEIGDMPIVGNWVYLLLNTVKKLLAFGFVFVPLIFGFALRFKFMFLTQVKKFRYLLKICCIDH